MQGMRERVIPVGLTALAALTGGMADGWLALRKDGLAADAAELAALATASQIPKDAQEVRDHIKVLQRADRTHEPVAGRNNARSVTLRSPTRCLHFKQSRAALAPGTLFVDYFQGDMLAEPDPVRPTVQTKRRIQAFIVKPDGTITSELPYRKEPMRSLSKLMLGT